MSSPPAALPELPHAGESPSVGQGLRSLRWFMAACALATVLLFAAFAAMRYEQLHEEARKRLERALAIAHEHALRVLETNDTLSRHVLSLVADQDDEALRAREPELHRQLVELSRNKEQLQSIWVIGADGKPVATTRFDRAPRDRDISRLPYFQWHAGGNGGVFASETIKGDGGAYFNISRGRLGDGGRFAGLVSVGLHSAYFTRFHEELSANEPGLAITMFREDGVVYSRWPPLPGSPERMSPKGEVLSRVLKGETQGTVSSVSSLDGQRRVILFRKLGDYPVYIGTGRELSAINTEWLRELSRVAAFVMLPMLGLVLAAYLALKRTREALESTRRLQRELAARRNAEEALLQAQKMEALGRLTGGVAHDFNNALMVISGNLHLLQQAAPGVPRKYADAIARAVASSTKLTRQLLAFSRRQALAPQSILLQEQLPALQDLLAPTLGSHVQLHIDVAPDTQPVHVDPAELELALINLAVNAKDAMPDGGEFRLTAANVPDTGQVAIEASDTGLGMSAETRSRALEPFFTTKAVGKGTGLGLSQVHGLCARAGGEVRIDSEPGRGTTVRMLFPPSAAAFEAGEAVNEASAPPLDCTVLLAEDNRDVAAVVGNVLEGLGCTVIHRPDAQGALDWLAAHAPGCDLLLTDVVMPGGIDGLQLADTVRELHPQVKVLLMTGYAQQIEQITRRGYEVLPKPFDAAALGRAIERALGVVRVAA